MKALLINTKDRIITEIEISTWEDIAPAIGDQCTTFACPIDLDNDDTMYVDDEGLFHPVEGGIMMEGWAYPIVGNIVLIGSNPEDGDMVDVKTSPDELLPLIKWQSKEDCEKWASNFN